MKLVTVAEMVAIEREANATGLTYPEMMENAGLGLAQVVAERYGDLMEGGVLGLVGSGNNGGDTLVALAHLARQGWPATAYLVKSRPDDDPLVDRLLNAGGELFSIEDDENFEDLEDFLEENSVLLDGVLGTGIQLPLRGSVAEVLDATRSRLLSMEVAPMVVAVDCPSGVDSDSGEAAPETIPADLTVTMAAIKTGLLQFPAFTLLGDLQLVGIGLPDDGEGLKAWRSVKRFVPGIELVRAALPERPADAHKGTFGTALVVAGSVDYTGAALLAGRAAYRIGAGLVTLAVPEPLHAALAGQFPEATWILLPHHEGVIAASAEEVLRKKLERATALLFGCGFGMEETTGKFVDRLIGSGDADREHPLPPLVIDADGLKLLGGLPEWHKRIPAQAVLTPHPGEMSLLTGVKVTDIQTDRLAVAERFSQAWGHVVVLKGAFTVVAAPDGRTAVIPVASPSLARAGTGDVLAGLIVGLRAQGLPAFEAAMAGAWIHGQAGLAAAELMGSTAAVLAGDVIEGVIDILAELE